MLRQLLEGNVADFAVQQVLETEAKALQLTHLWDSYRVPADVAGWLQFVIKVAEVHRVPFVLSDMTISGNPVVYANEPFCQMIGYLPRELLGRNCRCLQGPETEHASVETICESIRSGSECHVRLTNYRKDASTFKQLLSLRPMHDTNAVYRFCIGAAVELKEGTGADLEDEFAAVAALLDAIPCQIQTTSMRAAGRVRLELLQMQSLTQQQPPMLPATADMVLQALQAHFRFSMLSPEQHNAMLQAMKRVVVLPKQVVMRQGDPPQSWYVIVSGTTATECNGIQQPQLGPGAIFGDTSMLHDCAVTTSVTAITELELWALDSFHHREILNANDRKGKRLAKGNPPERKTGVAIIEALRKATIVRRRWQQVNKARESSHAAIMFKHNLNQIRGHLIEAQCAQQLMQLKWMQSPIDTVRQLVRDSQGREAISAFIAAEQLQAPTPSLEWFAQSLLAERDDVALLTQIAGDASTAISGLGAREIRR